MKILISLTIFTALVAAPFAAQAHKLVLLPPLVLRAKTIYIDNESADPTLQDIASLEMNKWGHFRLAESRAKADIILRLTSSNRVRLVAAGQAFHSEAAASAEDEPVRPGYTRLTLIDPKTGNALWSGQRKIKDAKSTGRMLDGLRDAFDQDEKARARF